MSIAGKSEACFYYYLLEYFKLFPDGDRLCPAFNTQLVINVADMPFHSRHGDDQLPGDILVGGTGFD